MNADLLPFESYAGYWVLLTLVGFGLLILAIAHLWPRFKVFASTDNGDSMQLKSDIDRDDLRVIRRRKKRLRIGLITGSGALIIAIILAVGAFTGRIAAMQDMELQREIEHVSEKTSKTIAEPLPEDEVSKLLNGESVAIDVVDENDVLHSVKFKYSNGSLWSLTKPHLAADETVEGLIIAGNPWLRTAESQAEGMFRNEVASKLESRYNVTLSLENRKELRIPSEKPSEGFKDYGSTAILISDESTGYKRVPTFLIWEGEFKLISESPDGSNLAEMNRQS